MTRYLAPLCLLLLGFAACSSPEEETAAGTEPQAAPAPADAGSAPFAAMTSRGPAAGGAPDAPGAPGASMATAPGGDAAGLDFDLPAGWVSQPPESGMRLAQAEIPGAGGPGQLAVFYFGPGGGGGVEANLERWIGQISPEDRSEPKRETFAIDGGLQVTWIEVSGTLQPSTTGMGPTTPVAGARLLGAVVEGPGGPWFFKATGPDATLAGQRDAFLGMLRSARIRA
jgi:hypothetical protein